MNHKMLNIEDLSPNLFIVFWVLFIGLIFTGIVFYFVFLRLNEDSDSYTDKKRKNLKKEKQAKKIASLYPKGKFK